MRGLGKISKIGKISMADPPKRRKERALVEARGMQEFTDETLPDDLRKASALIGSGKARRVHRLRQQGKQGSIPELLVMDWLERHKVDYEFQVWLPKAGTRLDFLIHPRAVALRIQGTYWHKPDDPRDKEIRYALVLMGFNVVDIMEDQVYRNLNQAMRMAIAGREIPK